MYFDDNPEPQNQEFYIEEERVKEAEKEGMVIVHIGGGDAIKYYDAKYQLMEDCQDFVVKSAEEDGMLDVEVNLGDESFV